MTHTPRRILLLEDNPGDARLVTLLLGEVEPAITSERFDVTCVTRLHEAKQRLQTQTFDAALVDLGLPDSMGLATLTEVLRVAPYLPVVILSGLGDEAVSIEAVKRGAQDYLVKGSADSRLLVNAIRYAIERKQRARTLEAIADVTRDMRNAYTTTEVLARIVDRICALFGTDEGVAEMVTPDGKGFLVVVARGHFAGAVGQTYDRNRGYTAELLEQSAGMTFVLDAGDSRTALPQFVDSPLEVLGAPMIVEGEALGALWVLRNRTPGHPVAFTEDDQTVLLAVADIAASAVKRASLTATAQYQKEQLQTVVDTVQEGLMLLDDQFQILLTNHAADRELGWLAQIDATRSLRALGGVPMTEVVDAAEAAEPYELQPAAEPGTVVEVRAYPLKNEAKGRGWLLAFRDVTNERRRRSREQQQARMAAVGQMAAGIAHQFNSSLASIVLYGDLLARSTGISADDQRRLHIILREARLTADLVQQLLDFSHQALVVRSHFDIVPFISRLLDIWTHTLPQTIVVAFECSDDVKLVRADPTRIQQALMNLVSFAEKAMPSGGTLWLAVESVAYDEGSQPMPELAAGHYVVITIKHSGSPIAPSLLPHIFEPFSIGEGVAPSSGLSLAQVYGIVAQHDGAIGVTSTPGAGTVFTIYLPQVVDPEAPSAEQAPAVTRSYYSTALVVLDDPGLLRQLQVRLSGRGRRVLTSTSGMDALRRYSVDLASVDLVVTTPALEDIAGDELWRVVREIAPNARAMFLTTDPAVVAAQSPAAQTTAAQAVWQPLPVIGPTYEAALAALVNQILAADTGR